MVPETISHYRILKKLGAGGMGEVYKARDTRLDRPVALKILPAYLVEDPGRVRRFVQEARSASALNHPNIVTIYEIGQVVSDLESDSTSQDGGHTIHYIAMEFVDGETLHLKIHRERADLKRLLGFLVQVADGLAKAHGAGIIHRDLKPENVMITEDGYVKILDFGLAKLVEARGPDSKEPPPAEPNEEATVLMDQTRPGMVMGTVGYMSPEQVQAKAVDQRSDIFSFGCMLYEAATGIKPFTGDSVIDSLHKIVYAQAPPLIESNPGAPVELQRIIRKCLAKDPSERYQSIKDVAIDLRELLKEYDSQPRLSGEYPQAVITASNAKPPVTRSSPQVAPASESSISREHTAIFDSPPAEPSVAGRRPRKMLWVGVAAALVVLAAAAFILYRLAGGSSEFALEQFTLKNGLRVILLEDHSAPTYSICVTYNVGSRDERPGRSGFAHLFEHMMFQGSENVGKGEHFILIENNGGAMDGSTQLDYTQYYQTLPANQLELGLFLESDRMRSLVINQANLDNQRIAVQEELRTRIDNQPYGKALQTVLDAAYDNFAYKHHPLGTVEDINSATVEEAAEFFKTYYTPSNAVVAIVGDFESAQARSKIERYFEDIPSQAPPPKPDLSEPEQQAERRRTMEDAFAQTPRIDIAYKAVPANTPDWHTLSLIGQVLVSGESSRLYQKLVKEKEVAASISEFVFELSGPSLAGISVIARPGKDFAQVEKLVYEEVERLKNEPVADWEMEKVLVQMRRRMAEQLQSTNTRAILLGRYAAAYNEPELINTLWDKISRVTKDDIQRVARTYLNDNNRTVLVITPKPGGGALTLQASAQAATPDSKTPPVSRIERKNRAPVSKDILQVKLPKVIEERLDNGLSVIVVEDERFPTVSVAFRVGGAGPVYEPAELPGLANITAQMLRQGTTNHTSKQIAEDLETRGATLFTSSPFGYDEAFIIASGLSDNFDEWFALTCDVLLNPVFPVDELNTLKQRLKVELQQQRSSPNFLADERFNRAVYGRHPASVMSTTAAVINGLTPEMLAKWHRGRYAPQNTILGIAGNIRASDVMPKLKKLLEGWRRTEEQEALPPPPSPATARRVYLVNRPGSVQTNIVLGNIALDRRDPDYVPLVVMNRIIGGGIASRLFINLREEKGYTYSINSTFTALRYPGAWRTMSGMRNEATEGAMAEMLKEITRIIEERVDEAELEERKRAVAARFAISLEQPTQLLNYAFTRKIYGFSADYFDTYPAKIMGVSADDVQRVARKYLNPAAMQLAAVGDAASIKKVLEKYGPVEVYDTEGNLLAGSPAPSAAANR